MRHALWVGAALMAVACSSAGGDQGKEGEQGEQGEHRASGQRSFEVGAFNEVEVAGAHDVIVTVGGAPSVRAEGDREALERLEVEVEDGRLRIGHRRSRNWFGGGSRRGVTVHVTAPTLAGASLAGSGDLRVDRVQAETFTAGLAGSGDLEIGELRAQRARFSIAGSGGINAAGAVEQAEVSIAGSGDVSLDSLAVRRASVEVAGSGDVSLSASETVEGSIMGSGNLTVRGSAQCSVTRMGSGTIRCAR